MFTLHLRASFAVLFLGTSCLPHLLAQVPQAKKATFPWSDVTLDPDKRADLVLGRMTLDEKIRMVHGTGLAGFTKTDPSIVRSNGGGGFVPGIEHLGIPDLNMSDSAVGVAGAGKKGRYATALPSGLALASSWDTTLAEEYGTLIGSELADLGFNVSLAGGVDITREPRNGRNFEYQGEDPILAGNMVASVIQGIQRQGVIGDVKHYVVNDSETGRYFSNSILDKRSMRETDLLAFEIAVKRANPGMVMCSYNLINGVYACENDYTLNQVLKKDWGFKGWVISDWGGTHSTQRAALAGLDQEQPSDDFFGAKLKQAVLSGKVPVTRLNDMVHRILRTEFAIGIVDAPKPSGVPDVLHGFEVARHVAEQSAVLLKNRDGQLPLNPDTVKSIAVIGSHADVGVLSGGGSAQVDEPNGGAVPSHFEPGDINAILASLVWDPSSPLRAIQSHVPRAKVTFESGTDVRTAVAAAQTAELAIVFVNQHTHEASDLETLSLPDNQDQLVEAVTSANPHTIVVVESGGPVAMPWADRPAAILESWFPGIQGGEAIANLLFGDVNPSGKLAVTFPKSDADLPRPALPAPPGNRPGPLDGIFKPEKPFDVNYSEGLAVGYKWFDAQNKEPLFPFGFGLSYTTYSYNDLKVSRTDKVRVSLSVQNTGKIPGAEIAELYLQLPASAGEPPKRLVGWQKVNLEPGETKKIDLDIDPLYLSVFDTQANHWKIVAGDYKVLAGSSSRDLPLSATIHLE